MGRVPLGLAHEQSLLPLCISLILKMSGVHREERGQCVCGGVPRAPLTSLFSLG